MIGPSGVGKTSIINGYISEYKDFVVARNFTTRLPRGEHDNEFVFVNKTEFTRLVNEDFFFEYEEICDNYYGTPRENLSKSHVFFNIDINGAINLQKEIEDLVIIFVITPSRQELIERLKNRKCNSDIEKRIARIDEEVHKHAICNYKIVNHSLTESIKILRNIVEIEKMRKDFDEIIHKF